MASRNPYQMDPYLAQGFSSLTKALIGDPETDYQVARTGYQDAQTNRLNTLLPFEQQSLEAQIAQREAARAAQAALAAYRGSQTTGQEISNTQAQQLLDALTTLSGTPIIQERAAEALGVKYVPNNNTEGYSALVRAMFGGKGNVQQRSDAFKNVAKQANENQAFDQIMDPQSTNEQIRRAFITMGKSPGPYFDSDAFKNELISKEDIAFTEANYEQAWRMYQADKEKESADYKTDQQIEAEKQFHREKQIIIDDGYMIFSPEAAKLYNITDTLKAGNMEVFFLDARKQSGRIEVEVEGTGETIYLEQDQIKNFNVINDGGKFILPKGKITTQKRSSVTADEAENLEDLAKGLTKSTYVPRGLMEEAIDRAANYKGESNDFATTRNIVRRLLEPIVIRSKTAGFGGLKIVPLVIDKIEENIKRVSDSGKTVAPNRRQKFTEKLLQRDEFGYSEKDAKDIVQYLIRQGFFDRIPAGTTKEPFKRLIRP